jgi:hypothetical protein
MRVFLDEDPAVDSDGDGNPANDVDHDVILDPSLCGTAVPPQATDVTFATDTFTVRFDDDACGTNPQQPFAVVRAANGGLTISSILVTQGCSTGQDVSALVRNITVNADTFAFNAPPAAAPGTTTIIQVPGPAGAPRDRRGRSAGASHVPGRHRAAHPRAAAQGRAVPARQRRAAVPERAAAPAVTGPHDHGRPPQPAGGELQRAPDLAVSHQERHDPPGRHAPQPQRRLRVAAGLATRRARAPAFRPRALGVRLRPPRAADPGRVMSEQLLLIISVLDGRGQRSCRRSAAGA